MKIDIYNTCHEMANSVKNIYDDVRAFIPSIRRIKSEDEMILEDIKKARSELEQAESIFNELTDNIAVDYATYNIMAAKAKYVYLLSLAKKRNIRL